MSKVNRISKERSDKALNAILQYGGTPVTELYEYPYTKKESDEKISEAAELLEKLIDIME